MRVQENQINEKFLPKLNEHVPRRTVGCPRAVSLACALKRKII